MSDGQDTHGKPHPAQGWQATPMGAAGPDRDDPTLIFDKILPEHPEPDFFEEHGTESQPSPESVNKGRRAQLWLIFFCFLAIWWVLLMMLTLWLVPGLPAIGFLSALTLPVLIAPVMSAICTRFIDLKYVEPGIPEHILQPEVEPHSSTRKIAVANERNNPGEPTAELLLLEDLEHTLYDDHKHWAFWPVIFQRVFSREKVDPKTGDILRASSPSRAFRNFMFWTLAIFLLGIIMYLAWPGHDRRAGLAIVLTASALVILELTSKIVRWKLFLRLVRFLDAVVLMIVAYYVFQSEGGWKPPLILAAVLVVIFWIAVLTAVTWTLTQIRFIITPRIVAEHHNCWPFLPVRRSAIYARKFNESSTSASPWAEFWGYVHNSLRTDEQDELIGEWLFTRFPKRFEHALQKVKTLTEGEGRAV